MNKNFIVFFLIFAFLLSGCTEDGIGEAFKPLIKEPVKEKPLKKPVQETLTVKTSIPADCLLSQKMF